ncbi:MAG TPA: radical SAM family heme chaperone HemW [Clostridia bacterium]|nr:radical SAM family heme chaperone HemW [Clostridia bacterium]
MINRSLYIHVPFCVNKCNYCDFFSLTTIGEKRISFYVEKCKKEIRQFAANYPKSLIKTIYFGGGTPSLLNPIHIGDILDVVYSEFNVAAEEVTIEVNPTTQINWKEYKQLGINRVSIGVQSLDDKVLKQLGRTHSSDMALRTLIETNKYFENVSCDLIIGTPFDPKITDLESHIELLSKYVKHFSTYILTVAEDTKMFDSIQLGELALPDDDTVSDIYYAVSSKLNSLGFNKYEVCNFAKVGFESKHNLGYWNRLEFFGVGPGASSYIDGKRFLVSPTKYFNSDEINYETEAILTKEDDMFEEIMLGLRLNGGFNILNFNEKFDVDFLSMYKNSIEKNKDFLTIRNNNIMINDKNILTMNSILVDFML